MTCRTSFIPYLDLARTAICVLMLGVLIWEHEIGVPFFLIVVMTIASFCSFVHSAVEYWPISEDEA